MNSVSTPNILTLRFGWKSSTHSSSDIFQGKVDNDLEHIIPCAILTENAYAQSEEYTEDGLAQQAAYTSDKIKIVFAFDPSPVTGFYDIPREIRNQNRSGIKVFRIYEHGEILAYARNLMGLLYPAPMFKTKDPAIFRLQFNFLTNKGFASQHDMRDLARAIFNLRPREEAPKVD